MALANPGKQRVVFACDNQQTVDAIKFGSDVALIQAVAESIFAWCLAHNTSCWPVWLPREHRIMRLADKRSRLRIPHDQLSPKKVIMTANSMAIKQPMGLASFLRPSSITLVGDIS